MKFCVTKKTQEPEETDLQKPVPRPREKRPPSGSYETWLLPHFRSRQSAHLEQRYTSQQISNATNANQVSTHLKSQKHAEEMHNMKIRMQKLQDENMRQRNAHEREKRLGQRRTNEFYNTFKSTSIVVIVLLGLVLVSQC